jgi:hypothetical protein
MEVRPKFSRTKIDLPIDLIIMGRELPKLMIAFYQALDA